MTVLCDRCGNEYHWGRIVKKDDKEFIQCPYCNFNNKFPKKKKRGKR